LKELENAIESCTKLKDELDSHTYNRYYSFGEKVRLLGAFLEDDFENVISALEEARDLIEELEEKVEKLEGVSENLRTQVEQLEAEIADAE